MFNNIIHPIYYTKTAQMIPEQNTFESVLVYKDAIEYIKCELQSTIQHESAHRDDEQNRNQETFNDSRNRSRGRSNRMDFSDFAAENRVEPLAEQAEEDCKSLLPDILSSDTESININQIFEEAKIAANIDPKYINDIKAGTLNPEAQGMYLMQDMPEAIAVEPTAMPNSYQGFDGSIWIDVRKVIAPFIVEVQENKPPTYQDDGIQPDVPNISRAAPSVESVSGVESVPSIEAR